MFHKFIACEQSINIEKESLNRNKSWAFIFQVTYIHEC